MGPPGSCRPQMGPMLAPWTLLSRMLYIGFAFKLISWKLLLHFRMYFVIYIDFIFFFNILYIYFLPILCRQVLVISSQYSIAHDIEVSLIHQRLPLLQELDIYIPSRRRNPGSVCKRSNSTVAKFREVYNIRFSCKIVLKISAKHDSATIVQNLKTISQLGNKIWANESQRDSNLSCVSDEYPI